MSALRPSSPRSQLMWMIVCDQRLGRRRMGLSKVSSGGRSSWKDFFSMLGRLDPLLPVGGICHSIRIHSRSTTSGLDVREAFAAASSSSWTCGSLTSYWYLLIFYTLDRGDEAPSCDGITAEGIPLLLKHHDPSKGGHWQVWFNIISVAAVLSYRGRIALMRQSQRSLFVLILMRGFVQVA